jgi:mono/diheme cytochrome c family protein
MKMMTRSMLALAAAMILAGEATFKAKCQGCHGSTGTPTPGMVKMMGVKPLSDPDVKKLTADQMLASVKNGKNKMPAFKDKLTDEQIKEAITYYRGLAAK